MRCCRCRLRSHHLAVESAGDRVLRRPVPVACEVSSIALRPAIRVAGHHRPKLYISPHHAMVWWFALLGLIWTAWPALAKASRKGRVDLAFQLILAVVLVQQVAFAAHALYFDNRYAFDGGEAAERFITQSAPAGTIASYTFFPTSLQPYSRTNLFINRPATYERWKHQDTHRLRGGHRGRISPADGRHWRRLFWHARF